MRLLVITQTVDLNHANLGFFHEWLKRLAARVEYLSVICLQKGESALPKNVTVMSLGKERGKTHSFIYAGRFYRALYRLRGQYDTVFVHMNPEYAILGGLFWRLTRKKVLLWYVHKAVNLRLRLAEKFVTKIFTASVESFRLPSKKVAVVGHGIDVEVFRAAPNYSRDPARLKVLSVGRVSASKDYETIVKGLRQANLGVIKQYDIVGEPITPADYQYNKNLLRITHEGGVSRLLVAYLSVKHKDMPGVYASHDLLIHASRTGSMDKVVLEALAAGRVVITSSEAFTHLATHELKDAVYAFPPGDYQELAKTIEKIWQSGILDYNKLPNQKAMNYVYANHNLNAVISKITGYFE